MDALDNSAMHVQEPCLLHGLITTNSGNRDQHLVFPFGEVGIARGDRGGNGRSRQAEACLFDKSQGRESCACDQGD